jgi:Holliday junction DNA helicase RuvB
LADVKGDGSLTQDIAREALTMLEIDELGLDGADRMLLSTIIENHNGGPVGIDTIAALVSEERTTIEDVYEPYLMQIGFLERTPRGRRVSTKAYRHLDYDAGDNPALV